MFQSGGVIKKDYRTVWTGTTAEWGNWSTSMEIGRNRWASYAEIYKRQLWVGVCVNKLAHLHARLPLKVYRREGLNRPEVPASNPYASLLANPNPTMSRVKFWLWTSSTLDIYGEWFWLKIRDAGGRPVQLAPLHPTAMTEEEDRTWTFDNGRLRMTGIPRADLVHVSTYNPDSLTRGLSPLEKLRATLENEDSALRAQSGFWRNGARPGYALSHPANLSKPAADRLKLQWQQAAGGADNTGTTVVLEEGMKPERLTISNDEAQYIDGRKLNREEVVAAYDLPPPAVHLLDRATFSNITEQFRSIYRDTAEPRTTWWESELETQLRGSVRPGATEPDFGGGVYAEFNLDGVLKGSPEQRAETHQKGINSGWITPAEVRKMENLPFIEGSDRLLVNSTIIPLDSAGLDVPSSVPPESIPADQARSVLGRLSRQKTLAEVDPDALVAGLNGSTPLVLAALNAAKSAGDDLPAFRDRLRALEAKE